MWADQAITRSDSKDVTIPGEVSMGCCVGTWTNVYLHLHAEIDLGWRGTMENASEQDLQPITLDDLL